MTFVDAVLEWDCQFDRDDNSFFSGKDDYVRSLSAGRNFWWKNERGFSLVKKNFSIVSVGEDTT